MTRWIGRATAVLVLAFAGIGIPATAASADASECADTYFSTGSRELFTPDQSYVPPPLRPFTPDCVSRLVGDSFDDSGAVSFGFNLVWVDISWDEFVAIVRSFEDSEWAEPGLITSFDFAGGGSDPLDIDTDPALSADDLAGLDPLDYAGARFSNIATREDIITISYTDGEVRDNSIDVDVPTLVIEVITDHTFVATALDDPSTLSDLPTVYAPTPVQWSVIAAGSLMLTLIVGWPSTLLNSVVGSRYQAMVHAVSTRFRRRPKGVDAAAAAPPGAAPGAAPATSPRRSRLPGWLMWPGFALAAVLGGFVDPDFGLNPMSLRLIVTLFLSFVLFNLGAWAVVSRLARRLQPESDPYLRFRWGSLILVAVAVLVARLLNLEPGVIFGLVAGVAYATTLRAAKSAVITIVGSAFGLALALVAWVGYSVLAPVHVDNFAYVFLVEFLAGVTVKGVSTLPLSLLPLGNLDGAKLFGWKKIVWGASYVVGLAGFMLVLLTIPKAWGEIPGDFVNWLLLFGGYAVVAIVIWAVNARMLKKRPLAPEAQQGDQPDAITID